MKSKDLKQYKEKNCRHWMIQNWVFTKDEQAEAQLAHALAVVAEKNKISNNDLSHLFPVILRILKSNIDWAK